MVTVLPASEAHLQPRESHAVLRPQACTPEALLPEALLGQQDPCCAWRGCPSHPLPSCCRHPSPIKPYTTHSLCTGFPITVRRAALCTGHRSWCSIDNGRRYWEAYHLAVCIMSQNSDACKDFTPALSGFGLCWRSLFIITEIRHTLHQPFQEAQHLISRRSSFAAGAAFAFGNVEVHYSA